MLGVQLVVSVVQLQLQLLEIGLQLLELGLQLLELCLRLLELCLQLLELCLKLLELGLQLLEFGLQLHELGLYIPELAILAPSFSGRRICSAACHPVRTRAGARLDTPLLCRSGIERGLDPRTHGHSSNLDFIFYQDFICIVFTKCLIQNPFILLYCSGQRCPLHSQLDGGWQTYLMLRTLRSLGSLLDVNRLVVKDRVNIFE